MSTRLLSYMTEERDRAQHRMDAAQAGSLAIARHLGRRDAFDDMIEHIASDPCPPSRGEER